MLVEIVLYENLILHKKINVFFMKFDVFIRLFLNVIKTIIFKQIIFSPYEFNFFYTY